MTASEEIDEMARALFHKADATNVWAAVDHMTQLYWRKEAARKLQAAITHDTQRSLPIISGNG